MPYISNLSLRARLGISVTLLIIFVCASLTVVADRITHSALVRDAQLRQDVSLQILANEFENQFESLAVSRDTEGTINRITWSDIPSVLDHNLIDKVGTLSRETATLFVWDSVEGDFVRLSTNIIKPDGNRAVGTYLGKQNPVFAAIRQGRSFRGEAIILGKPYLTIYQPVFDASGTAVAILYVGVDRTEIDAALADLRSTLLTFSLIALAVGTTCALFLISYLLKPLASVSGAVERIAAGDLATQVPHANAKTEIGDIARRIELFQEGLRHTKTLEQEGVRKQQDQTRVITALRNGLAALSNGSLNDYIASPTDAPFPSEYEELRGDFNAVVDTLANTISQARATAESVYHATNDISDMSTTLAQRVKSQAVTLAGAASTLTDLSVAGRDVAQQAEEADVMAKTSLNLSTQSREVLESAMASINRIENSSDQINQFIVVIEDIAFQTNLLALNAGVEAARAGDAGKGFAVVASEVRELSIRATDSANEIKKLILESRTQIGDGAARVQDTGKVLGELFEQVEQMGSIIGEIATSIQQQTKGETEVSQSVQQMDQMTQDTAQLSQQALAASETLQTEANRLTSALAQFQTAPMRRDTTDRTAA